MMVAGQAQDHGVRVIVAYEDKVVGQVIYPPGMLRDVLVQRGFVERVKPAEEKRRIGKTVRA